MANTATELSYTGLDHRIIDIGRIDAELGAAYQRLIEELDYAGQLSDDRAQRILVSLDAMLAVMREAACRTCLHCIKRMRLGEGLICELCDAHGATATRPPAEVSSPRARPDARAGRALPVEEVTMFKRKRKHKSGKRQVRLTTVIVLVVVGYVAYRVMWDSAVITAGLPWGSW